MMTFEIPILSSEIWLAWFIWLIPLFTSFLEPLLAKFRKDAAHILSILSLTSAATLSLALFFQVASGAIHTPIQDSINWLVGGPVEIELGVLVDPFSVLMSLVVSIVASIIFIFSVGYMHNEPDIGRYWFWMNFFAGSMLLLVLSNNLLQMFLAWEMVGLSSWALISFWYKSKEKSPVPGFKTEGEYNAHCGLKALVTTSFADAFFLVAIGIIGFITYSVYGKSVFNFLALSEDFTWLGELSRLGLIPIVSILMISGPFGKSAQFPYNEWLPEAMAGPTTVSALIHAATMVKAGAYFMGRFFLVVSEGISVYPSITTFFVIAAYIGAFTAFLAGTQGMVAVELKKVLAYSTISQLGYIFAAFGIAGAALFEEGFIAGTLHIVSHAIFKALLFLCAGSVLHAVHTKYMTEMGGLRKYMPITYWTMLIGALSLSGIPFFAGFFSKDAIIHTAFTTNMIIPWILLLVTAAITIFYVFRMIGMTFYGEESEHIKHLEAEGIHVHESPKVMTVPLIILAGLTVIIGFLFPAFIEFLEHGEITLDYFVNSLGPYIIESFASPLFVLTMGMVGLGFIPSWYIYIQRKIDPKKLVEGNVLLRSLYKFLVNRWYFNALYYKIADFIRSLGGIANIIELLYDKILRKTVVLFNYIANGVRKVQTGLSNVNILYMIAGFIAFVAILLFI
ncbi:MAG: NADH-quinone oxidoreductase subunit L [Candidatus Njordarchaeum guaymaensis]